MKKRRPSARVKETPRFILWPRLLIRLQERSAELYEKARKLAERREYHAHLVQQEAAKLSRQARYLTGAQPKDTITNAQENRKLSES